MKNPQPTPSFDPPKDSTSLAFGTFSNSNANVDPGQAGYYRELSEKWWDTSGPFWPLHGLNAIRVQYLRGILCAHFGLNELRPRPLEGLRVLDIGCGGGLLSEAMARLTTSIP